MRRPGLSYVTCVNRNKRGWFKWIFDAFIGFLLSPSIIFFPLSRTLFSPSSYRCRGNSCLPSGLGPEMSFAVGCTRVRRDLTLPERVSWWLFPKELAGPSRRGSKGEVGLYGYPPKVMLFGARSFRRSKAVRTLRDGVLLCDLTRPYWLGSQGRCRSSETQSVGLWAEGISSPWSSGCVYSTWLKDYQN